MYRYNVAVGVDQMAASRQRPEPATISIEDMNTMKTPIIAKIVAVAAVATLAGCTDLKPLQAEIDSLKTQVSSLQTQVAAAKSSADAANGAAASAASAANGAQSTANQALSAAQASQACCDATNEKIDRMFKRSISK